VTLASNGDIPATEVVHVPNLNDVQPFMTVPMEVDASGGIPEAGTVPFPDFFEGVEDVELFEQVENAINNSWRFDLYKNSAPAAPEEPDPTFGLTKEESTWLLMLMRGPVLEARARANQEASYLRSLGSTTYTKEHYLRSSDLTTKEFDKEVNEFFGGDNGDDEEDVEMDIDEDTSEDELCLIKTSWTTPAKKTEVTAVDYTDPVSPFDHHLEERLAGNAVDEDDEMNPEGVFRPLNDSALEMEEGFASEVQKRSISNTVAIPKTLDKTVDVDDEESEYEAPGTFGTPPSPNNNYTHGPFMTENIDLHPDRPAEAVLPGHMTLNGSDRNQDHNSELSPEQLEQAIASLKKSDQPMNLVSSEGETILNTISGAGLQVGVELNASATKRNADSPGPFTKLLDFTDDDEIPTALDTRTADLGMEELALGERVYKSTTMEVAMFQSTSFP